jgi:hypothetical protein
VKADAQGKKEAKIKKRKNKKQNKKKSNQKKDKNDELVEADVEGTSLIYFLRLK